MHFENKGAHALRNYKKDKRTAEARPQLEHRHFAVVADTIRMMMPLALRRATAMHFATHFADRNKKFDRERFLHACGVGDDS